MSKMDRQGSRTPAELERKYNFGKTFAEFMGLANEAQQAAEEAKRAAQEADGKLTQDEIFAILTNDGASQGIFLDEGLLYINASYIRSGIIQGVKIIGESGTIGGFDLSANTISATYRKEFNFTQDDLTTIETVFRNFDTYTEEEQAAYLRKYDTNMNGMIDAGDAVFIVSFLKGNTPTYTEGTITIDATNPVSCIVVEVTGGHLAGEKTTIGLGGIQASRVGADSFSCKGSSGYTGEVAVGDAVLTIKGGIITAVS